MTQTIITAGDASAGLVQQGGNDGTLVLQTGAAGAKVATVSLDTSGNVAVLGAVTQNGIATPRMVLSTTQATTSGTAIDFTGIPSWVKRITVMFSGVSTTGTNTILVQIGSGSVTTSGYISYFGFAQPSGVSTGTSTAGFGLWSANAADVHYGSMTLNALGSNLWVSSTAMGVFNGTSNFIVSGGGNVTLGSAIDRLRVTTVGGTDAFDAGSINILYEG